MNCGFYPGSFDPPTLGHRDIIRRGLRMFDRLVVGIGVHPSKMPMFPEGERVAMLEEEFCGLAGGDRARAILFQGLTVEAARKEGARFIVRGLRDTGDLNYEMQMSGMNAQLAPDIETIFVAASPETAHITATLVRQIADLGGDVSAFVSPAVLHRIRDKFKVS
ncbi:MAG: pantetheine-phosphate adenylyltransferase [Rhodomicrobium sp.]